MKKHTDFQLNPPLSLQNCYFFCLVFLVYFLSGCTKQDPSLGSISEDNPVADPFSKPKITYISDLPDSLQPATFLLSEMPPPKVIPVPKQKGAFYERVNVADERQRVELEPPQVHPFSVLTDEDGQYPLGIEGKPFVLGFGGIGQFTNYNTNNGLALDGIRGSLLDSRGHLWFGTYSGGVSRFDGTSFTNFTADHGLASNIVTRVFEDSKGNIWFTTNGGGVGKYNGKVFSRYTTEQGLPDNVVWSIAEDSDGNIWFGTYEGGVSKFDGNSFTNYNMENGLPANFVLSMLIDRDGIFWFGTLGGLSRYDGVKFENYTKEDGLPSNYILSIIQDHSGNYWIGTVSGLSKFDGQTFSNFSIDKGMADLAIWDLLEDQDNNIWLATSYGLSVYDGNQFKSFTTDHGLASNSLRSIVEDLNGHVWAGTEDAGISRFDGLAFTNFTKEHGLIDNMVENIFEDSKGNLWFGTFLGLSKYDGYSFINYSRTQGMVENGGMSMAEAKDGMLWIGTLNGLSRFDGTAFTNFTLEQGLAGKKINCILIDQKDNLWLGTSDGGVSKFDGNGFTNFSTEQGLADYEILSMIEDDNGHIWIATYDGLSHFDGESFTNYSTDQGLASNVVLSISKDEAGNLWFGTENGLSFLSKELILESATKGPEVISFESFTTEDGLHDNLVSQVLAIQGGRIVTGSNKGISIFNSPIKGGGGVTKITNSEVFNNLTGHPVKDITGSGKTLFLDSKGIIWIGTGSKSSGLVRFDYHALKKNKTVPRIWINQIQLSEENVSWSSILTDEEPYRDSLSFPALQTEEVLRYQKILDENERKDFHKKYAGIKFSETTPFFYLPEDLTLPYRHNQLTFEFASTELSNPQLVEYQYILEGYDRNWSPVLQKTNATFGNIREGNYTFKVKARYTGISEEGTDSWTEPVVFSFRVLPPWYRTWWAYLIYALLIAGTFRLYIKRRELALKNRQEELEHTVYIRTAELRAEKKKSDDLLLNILPEEVAEELKAKGSADAKLIDEVTVLFTDFKGFTQLSEKLSPRELVAEINDCFSAFDHIMQKHKIEKIKTIGDAYMAAGGLPTPNQTHAKDVVNAALDIQEYMKNHRVAKQSKGDLFFEIRIGIHTGPVVAGIVGVKKFQYDIWGDTVNTASRMESSGETGKVNISGTTYEEIKEFFKCSHRGKIAAKGKGEIDMYFVERNDLNLKK
ncbi:adenylate/guanylate cyclase domain-containing protein [Aquiflexum sp.]|uniref:adenylate/guanylate cyclase domain-containing protein n=1 Tax=Aquiflexum sp. TaxID=1872584 RepID=UPI0035939147